MERAVSLIESNDVQAHVCTTSTTCLHFIPLHLPQVFQSALAIQQCRFRDASALVSAARKLIQPDVAALASESYSRAYPLMVKMQVLSEFDEVIQWHERGGLAAHEPDELSGLLVMWKSRLLATERLSVYWEEILATRSLLVSHSSSNPAFAPFIQGAERLRSYDHFLYVEMPSVSRETLTLSVAILFF